MAAATEVRGGLEECSLYDDHFASESFAHLGIEATTAVADAQPDRRSIAGRSLEQWYMRQRNVLELERQHATNRDILACHALKVLDYFVDRERDHPAILACLKADVGERLLADLHQRCARLQS